MPKIIITADRNGGARVEVDGCTGDTCANLTAGVEKALGSVEKDTKKAEFYETAKADQHVSQ